MEVFRPQNVYADLSSVCIDLKIWSGCFAGIWSVRWEMGFECGTRQEPKLAMFWLVFSIYTSLPSTHFRHEDLYIVY